MATSTLKRLTVRAFRSMVDEQSIDLPRQGMVLVAGQNKDTDGSSGAGKTSLVEALAFALGYGEFTATDLQSWSWLTDESIRVKLEFDSTLAVPSRSADAEMGPVLVQRGTSAFVETTEKKHTSAKAIAEQMDALMGLNPTLLKALTYRPQKTPGLFLAMTDSEKKEFLTDLLGLERYQSVIETCDLNILNLTKEHTQAKAIYDARVSVIPAEPPPPTIIDPDAAKEKVSKLQGLVSATEAVLLNLKGRDEELTAAGARGEQDVDDKYRLPFAEAMAKLEAVQADKPALPPKPDKSAIQKKLDWLSGEMQRRKLEHTTKEGQLTAAMGNYRRGSQRLEALQVEKGRLEAEKVSLLQSACPTCKRTWDKAVQALAVIDEKLAGLVQALADAEESEKCLQETEAALIAHRKVNPIPQKMVDAENELRAAAYALESAYKVEVANVEASYKVKVAEAKAEPDRIRAEWNAEKSRAQAMTPAQRKLRDEMSKSQNELSSARQSLSNAQSELRDVQRNNQVADEKYLLGRKAHFEAMQAAQSFKVKVEEVQAKLDAETDFKAMLKSFLGLVFDETLARVSDLTNDRLARIPNVSGLTMAFESERETQTGKVKQTITPVVRKDGNVIPLKAGTSGGMYTAVELAVDLSLSDVIAERTGIRPGWLLLDEAFEGLDTVCKQACFEMLRDVASDRLVMVIDHTREFTEMFDKTILMKYEGGKTTVAGG